MSEQPALPPIAEVLGESSAAGQQLREVFSRTLSRTTAGAQLVVTLRGETVVDIAGGGVTQGTPIQVFSVSKVIVAIAAAHAHAAGRVDLDAPLATYWPAFDRDETRSITARMVLGHTAGLSALTTPVSLEQLLAGVVDDALATQDPLWEPGTAHGYAPFTFGALMARVFQHGVGQTVQDYATQHIIGPCGGGFWFGAPNQNILEQLAPLTFDPPVLTEAQVMMMHQGNVIQDGAMAPFMEQGLALFSDPRVQQADWPAASGIGTARSLSRILNGALGYGTQLLEPAALQQMIAEQSHGMDKMLGRITRFGSGVELPHVYFPYFGAGSFGHQGGGGAAIAADPETGLTLAYTSTHTAATVGGSDQALVLMAAAQQFLEGK